MTSNCKSELLGWLILFIVVGLGLSCILGCSPPSLPDVPGIPDVPTIQASRILHVRPEHRVENYAGGSCVFATAATQLNYLDHPQAAKWMRSRYAGGEYPSRLDARLRLSGIDFTSDNSHDFAFIQQALVNRLPVGVDYPDGHAQLVVGYAAGELHMIDNNRPERIHKVPYARFMESWGGWAWTIVQAPPPPF